MLVAAEKEEVKGQTRPVDQDRIAFLLKQSIIFCANLGGFAQAKGLAKAYAYLDPESDGPLVGEAYALMAANKPNQAVRLLYKAVQDRETVTVAHAFLGMALIFAKFHKRAKELLELVAASSDEVAANMAKDLINEFLVRQVEAVPQGVFR